ncbi:MAG: flagellar export protein FliJ [Humidesulfovibrio sp.]|nr:flagellar export protein FliJ [Humidesulfovibrio sp.]
MAKPFAFRLEKVLEYRRQLEDQARMALAQAQAQHDAQKRIIADLSMRMTAHMERGFGRNATQADIWLWSQYRDALGKDLIQAKTELERLASILQVCREEAVLRSREKKLLEKLKDRQAKKYHEQESQREQKEFDEMATIRHKSQDR